MQLYETRSVRRHMKKINDAESLRQKLSQASQTSDIVYQIPGEIVIMGSDKSTRADFSDGSSILGISISDLQEHEEICIEKPI